LSEPVIDGDRVYIEDNKCRIEAYPHTTTGGWVHIKITSKVYSGEIDFVLGFDKDISSLRRIQLYKPREEPIERELKMDERWFNDPHFKVQYTYSKKEGNWIYDGNLKVWTDGFYEEEPDGPIGDWIKLWDIDFTRANLETYFIYWEELIYREWLNLGDKLSWKTVNYEYSGMNKWFYIRTSIEVNREYHLRVWFDVTPSLDYVGGKYAIAIKPANKTFHEAIRDNQFYFLDPWYNASWNYRKSHIIIGSSGGSRTNYPIRLEVHYGSGTDSGNTVYLNGHCRADFGDVRFTSSDGRTLLDYWIEKKTDNSVAIIWVEIPNLPASPDTVMIYIYYGNSNAETTSSGTDTFNAFYSWEDGFESWTLTQHGDDGDCTRSTLRSYDGSYSIESDQPNVGSPSHHHFRSPSISIPSPFFRIFCAHNVDKKRNAGTAEVFQFKLEGASLDTTTSAFMIDSVRNNSNITAWDGDGSGGGAWDNMQPKALDTWKTYLVKGNFNSYEYEVVIDGNSVYGPYNFRYNAGPSVYQYIEHKNDNFLGYLDCVWVATWVDPEPTHGAWGDEETQPSWRIDGLTNLSKIMGILLSNILKINSVQ